ncbi:lactate utilization protein [Clostridium kluyveri]|uniref:Lactate utilization protein n=1 Tax=Clostridium kluyveri TaxID=1534 RepID=A0A1L5FCY8_CLOKL|nr:lactate utilization protein [Clostridium kluyveri]APM40847.1 lactate utilization protein [Clostridium kluyveri]UZQ52705.1 lactate utilization protein [Clostridium kluyveri]
MEEKNSAIKTRNELLATKLIKNLRSRKFEAYYCDNAIDAAEKALSLIPESSSVSWGGSVTLEEIELIERIYQGNFIIIDRDKAQTMDERYDLMRQSLLCDTYLTSFNAISEDGVLINIDSVGNRVAAITFGPKNVIAVIGMNKVCKTVEDAVARARTYAAPINAQRCSSNPFLHPPKKTPCVINGACGNCKAEDCICSYVIETRMCKTPGRIKIILVGESLGF